MPFILDIARGIVAVAVAQWEPRGLDCEMISAMGISSGRHVPHESIVGAER